MGIELVFRVLGCKSKRITVTHKKTLVRIFLASILCLFLCMFFNLVLSVICHIFMTSTFNLCEILPGVNDSFNEWIGFNVAAY